MLRARAAGAADQRPGRRLSIAATSGGYLALFTVLAAAAAALAAIAPSPAGLGGLAAGSGGDGRQARREPPDTIG